jgi:adenylate cyclase
MATERVERRLAAILAADVAGYSRLMGTDEVGTLAALKSHRSEVVDPAIAEHHGRVVKTTGDGMLIEFASAVEAVNCAMAVQLRMVERNRDAAMKIVFRIGINVGDVIVDGDDIFGDGVNVAARVENECEPGGVYLSTSLGQLGRYDSAATAISELCKLRPGLTISAFRNWPHLRSLTSSALDHIAEGLRKAGLPE